MRGEKMMGESMTKSELNKTELFADYISRYEYKDMNKAMEDFVEIFEIIDTISYALQINSFICVFGFFYKKNAI